MSQASAVMNPSADRQWFIVGRWQEFEGEGRANLLRIVAVGVFYAVQLTQVFWLTDAVARSAELPFHRMATAVAAAWSLLAVAVLLCLRSHLLPAGLKFFSTAVDIALLTFLAIQAGGPNSPLVFGYFLIVAISALRFNLPLVWFATLGCLLGYLTTVGAKDERWFDADHVVRPVEQLLMLASLALTGIVMGQVIRRVRGIAAEYAKRMQGGT